MRCYLISHILLMTLAFCSGCAGGSSVHIRGQLDSNKNVRVIYNKSEEQKKYEKEVKTTQSLAKIPINVFMEVFRIPIGLLMVPVGAVDKAVRKISN